MSAVAFLASARSLALLCVQVILQRNRRQLRRYSIASVIGPLIAAGDAENCDLACEAWSTNERLVAAADPLRGPSRRNHFFRSGGTTLGRRYNRRFALLGQICNNICGSITSKRMYLCPGSERTGSYYLFC